MGRSVRALDLRRSGIADPEGRQRVGVLREIPRVLQLFGADPAKVFRTAGLDPRILDHPDNEISFVAMGRLFQASVEATGCEHFGLLAGQGLNLQSLGVVGQLMRTAPNLDFALWDLALTQARNADGAVSYLRPMEESLHRRLCDLSAGCPRHRPDHRWGPGAGCQRDSGAGGQGRRRSDVCSRRTPGHPAFPQILRSPAPVQRGGIHRRGAGGSPAAGDPQQRRQGARPAPGPRAAPFGAAASRHRRPGRSAASPAGHFRRRFPR